MHSLLMYLALAATSSAWANAGANIQLPPAAKNTVYKCEVQGRTHYSDTPCPGAVEVDVTPTRGVHSMSGTKRTSAAVQHEAMLENMQRARQQAMARVLPASASAQPAVAQPAHAVQPQALASAPQPARTSSSALDPMQIIHGMLSTLLQAVQPLLWFLPLLVLVLIVKTAAFKGWIGELLIRQLLKKRPAAKAEKELHLHNVTLKDDRGTTQIECVYKGQLACLYPVVQASGADTRPNPSGVPNIAKKPSARQLPDPFQARTQPTQTTSQSLNLAIPAALSATAQHHKKRTTPFGAVLF